MVDTIIYDESGCGSGMGVSSTAVPAARTYIYRVAQRKYWYHGDLPAGWTEGSFVRGDYIECQLAWKLTSELTDDDRELVESYGRMPDEWIGDVPPDVSNSAGGGTNATVPAGVIASLLNKLVVAHLYAHYPEDKLTPFRIRDAIALVEKTWPEECAAYRALHSGNGGQHAG